MNVYIIRQTPGIHSNFFPIETGLEPVRQDHCLGIVPGPHGIDDDDEDENEAFPAFLSSPTAKPATCDLQPVTLGKGR
jgi:hypothetical protein